MKKAFTLSLAALLFIIAALISYKVWQRYSHVQQNQQAQSTAIDSSIAEASSKRFIAKHAIAEGAAKTKSKAGANVNAKARYVGAAACGQCHSAQLRQWQGSHHAKAMQEATPATVLANFSDVTVEFHGISSRFYQGNGQFLIDTLGDNQQQTFTVRYTFGHYPLQQYLIELADGHIQAFDVAWDSRPADEGGQRWYHLQPDEKITAEHPFFWSKHFQNWNSRCADCHSTNVRLNYNASSHRYNTQWSEINVACEACHGPASEHVKRAESIDYANTDSGFAVSLKNTNHFVFNAIDAIATNQAKANNKQLNSCAGCHSRRTAIAAIDNTKDYHSQFALSALDDGLYFGDGQINDEVFVYGSFLQSKMHRAGVTCSNCHNPHSARLTIEGNGLCLQCHKASAYNAPSHHRHQSNSKGAACVNCHMPERTYMQVDGRRDHSFSLPRPALASRANAPNACGLCHNDWSAQHTINAYQQLFGAEPPLQWAEANINAQQRNTLALRSITTLANDSALAPIRRASLMRQAAQFPAQITLEALQLGLRDNSPLVRSAAVESLAFLPPRQRLEILLPLVNDPAKVVRMAVANQLVGTVGQQNQPLQTLFNEYEQSLLLSQNHPGSHINLGSFYQRQGQLQRAKQAYERALFIEPAFVPALVNLADMSRAEGDDNAAKLSLHKALAIAPDSASVNYSLGLLQVRQKNMPQALILLKTAATLPSAEPRFAYAYAIALESVGSLNKAIAALTKADKRWPNQPELLMALANYLDRYLSNAEKGLSDGDEATTKAAILPVLSRLSRLMPSNSSVQRLVRKYTR